MSDEYKDLYGDENKSNIGDSMEPNVQDEDKKEDAYGEYHYKGSGDKESIYSNSQYTQPYSTQESIGATHYSQQYVAQSGAHYTNAQQGSVYGTYQTPNTNPYAYQTPPIKPKKEKKGASKGFVAALVIIGMLVSSFAGFVGAIAYTKLKADDVGISDNGAMIINKVDIDEETAEGISDKSTSQIADEVADSVVEITTEVMTTNSFYGQYISQGAGSGVIISADGYIVTNNHVIDGATSITVTLRDKTTYDAKLIGTDSIVDVALLKIEAEGLKAATFGDSDNLKVGDKAVAIGNPLGQLGGTVTDGIISALDRDVVIDGETMNLLQTDTAINPGNSGGGLFDGQGALVGVVVAKSSGEEIEGLGFAIPINDVLDILDDLKEYGYVRGRVSIGVQLIDLTNEMYAMYYYGNDEAGCYVYSVEFDSSAYNAGIQQGDRIVSVDGKKITTSSEVEDALEGKKVGDKVKLELERGTKTATVELELGEYVPEKTAPSQQNQNDIFNPFG